MQKLSTESVRGWARQGSYAYPAGVATLCPHCSEKVVFTLRDEKIDEATLSVSAVGRCPGCKQGIAVWSINRSGDTPKDIYMYPPCTSYHELTHADAGLPPPLKRAYVSTIEAYNSKNFAATAVCCRRTLEGIFKYMLPEDRRSLSLARAIAETAENVDFGEPIKKLSTTIKDGGNLGAHFDMEKEPSEAMARSMVELLEYLISYLYVLPSEIGHLEQELEGESQ